MAMEISICAAHMVTAEVPGRDITTPRRWGMSLGGALTLRISQVWRNKYLAIKVGVQKRKQDKLEAIAKLHMGADALEDRMRKEAGLGRAAADPFQRAAVPAASYLLLAHILTFPHHQMKQGRPSSLAQDTALPHHLPILPIIQNPPRGLCKMYFSTGLA